MSYHDLQDLKHRISAVGESIRQQERFYGDINEFLHQVYQTEKISERRSLLPPEPTRMVNYQY